MKTNELVNGSKMVWSPNGTLYPSPGATPWDGDAKTHEPRRGGLMLAGVTFGLSRPFRALVFRVLVSQGVALGCDGSGLRPWVCVEGWLTHRCLTCRFSAMAVRQTTQWRLADWVV
jgi:hypothetical protein